MKKIVNSPIFYFIRDFFTGDNVTHYLPAKYLWTVCNVTKTGFYQPVYDFKLEGPITLDFMFYPEQPQHKYFKKPVWINEFIVAKDTAMAQQIALHYDYFINNYRCRGAQPVELNWGYPTGMPAIDLYLAAYTHKAVYEQGIYLDDLFLADEYQAYLQSVNQAVNPDRRPVIALHQRGHDRWKRNLPNSAGLSEALLYNLLDAYPEHQIVLLGESWRYHRHPRIKYLEDHINLRNLKKEFKDYSACLQFILAAYFCRDVDLVFNSISGFTQFIECIRPLDRTPPIPIFWGPKTFTGICTRATMAPYWTCRELTAYKNAHPKDAAFQQDTPHLLYYSRNEALLKPYCLDYPNNLDKIFALLKKISEVKFSTARVSAEPTGKAGSHGASVVKPNGTTAEPETRLRPASQDFAAVGLPFIPAPRRGAFWQSRVKEHKVEIRALPQSANERLITYIRHFKPYIMLIKRIYQIIFLEKAGLRRIIFIIRELMMK